MLGQDDGLLQEIGERRCDAVRKFKAVAAVGKRSLPASGKMVLSNQGIGGSSTVVESERIVRKEAMVKRRRACNDKGRGPLTVCMCRRI